MIDNLLNNFLDDIEKNTLNKISEIEVLLPTFINFVSNIISVNEIEIKQNRKKFNVFNCLTKHHLEELHTNFIVYLFDIKQEHYLKEKFLRLFFETLKETNKELDVIIKYDLDVIKHFYIKKNHFIGYSADNENEYGFIDIYVETDNYVVAIENKITAYEQPKQIARYASYCKRQIGKIPIILFLNPWGYLSNQSGNEKYYVITYFETILLWLDKCIDFSSKENISIIKNGLEFYKNIVERKILNITTSDNMKEIKKIILSEQNLPLLKHWTEISKSVLELQKDLRKKFIAEIRKKLSGNFEISKEGNVIIFLDEKLQYKKGNDEIVFQIEENDNGLYYGLFPKQLSEKTINSKNFQHIKQSLQDNLETEDDADGWILWKWFKDGYSDNFYYTLATNLDNVVNELFDEIKEYLEIWETAKNELKK